MNVHEEQFARSFIIPEKRARYLELLDSERGRKKLVWGKLGYFEFDEQGERYILEK